jgi:glycosyltransferase involved in cell wall biosynthesis
MSVLDLPEPRVAVLIPCYNEELTIEKVVGDFRRELSSADIYVYDNNSSDRTAELAERAGAEVRFEKRQGKGFVLQSMFEQIDADYYVLVDGDDTYPADRVHDLLAPLLEGRADMTVGSRLSEFEDKSFRRLHVFGNRLVIGCINLIFHSKVKDVMSGYRGFTRECTKTIPIVSKGFEIETELTLQALYRNLVIREIPIRYGERPAGSVSKLSTFRDGFRVLLKIFHLFKAYRPLLFFTLWAVFFGGLGLLIGSVPVIEFIRTGLVLHFPSAILAGALEVIAVVSFTAGVILDTVNQHFRELSELTAVLQKRAELKQVIHNP